MWGVVWCVGRARMRVDELAASKDPIRTELVLYLAGIKAPKRISYCKPIDRRTV